MKFNPGRLVATRGVYDLMATDEKFAKARASLTATTHGW
jgi:hypothetical protein